MVHIGIITCSIFYLCSVSFFFSDIFTRFGKKHEAGLRFEVEVEEIFFQYSLRSFLVRFAHLFHAKTQRANPETSGAKRITDYTDERISQISFLYN